MKKIKFNFVKPALVGMALCFAVWAGVSILHSCDTTSITNVLPSDTSDDAAQTGKHGGTQSKFSDEAIVVNEMHKYKTSVVLFVDNTDINTDITNRVLQLNSGQQIDPSVIVEPAFVNETSMFVITTRGGLLLNYIPPSVLGTQAGPQELVNADIGVITLSFRKEKVSRTLDLTVRVDNKANQQSGTAGTVKQGDTYLLYGYDVINSRYFNNEDVKKNNPVLDLGLVNAFNKIASKMETRSSTICESGENALETNDKLNVSANVGYKNVLFSVGASTGYTTTHNSKSVNKFSTLRSVHRVRDEWLEGVSAAELKKLVTNKFKSDIERMSANEILNTYGTHLITRAYWGGSIELDFSYAGTEYSTSQQLTAAVNACYAGVSGGASTEYNAAKTELANQSKLNITVVGGAPVSWNSIESLGNIITGFGSWAAGLAASATFCGVPFEMNEDAMFPIWKIVGEFNSAKAAAVEAEFNKRVEAAESNLLDIIGAPGILPPRYRRVITQIGVQNVGIRELPAGWKFAEYKLSSTGQAIYPRGEVVIYKVERVDINVDDSFIADIALTNSNVPPEGWQLINDNFTRDMISDTKVYLIYRRGKAGAWYGYGDKLGITNLVIGDNGYEAENTGGLRLYGTNQKYNILSGTIFVPQYVYRTVVDLTRAGNKYFDD